MLAGNTSAQLSGLLFPSNSGTDANTVMFRLTGANCPSLPFTVIWRVRPVQQTGYYTTLFWANQDADFINNVKPFGYAGFHPYPRDPGSGHANGTVHDWEISTEGNDYITDDNANDPIVVKDGTWYQQAVIATQVGNELRLVYYWNLSVNANRVMTYQTTTSPNFAGAASRALMFGDAFWNPADELLSGTLRTIQVFGSALSLSNINSLRTVETDSEALTTASGLSLSHWYLNMNPTPSDVTDKSGNGRDASWLNSNRPSLVTL